MFVAGAWADTHAHTRPNTQTSTEGGQCLYQHPHEHPQHSHRREHHRWPHAIPSPRAVGGWSQAIFTTSVLICEHTSVGSLNINTDFKSIQYTQRVPTHRLRLWVFPYIVLFLLTSWSDLKFMSSLHTQARGVTHTENRMDLIRSYDRLW